ncbi:MAG: polysaccharide biosynthesis tyrosine autokinase [Candidatus Hydrogenedentes bacterium]|nr:polysaccharide biosynthesis tyrosine autokinase [Candidatus Hydrogenedentota bacterium]
MFRKKDRRKLGEKLLESGKISQDQLHGLLEQQQRCGRYLGELVVADGYITEHELYALLPKAATKGGLFALNPRNALDITELYLQQTAMKFTLFSDEPIRTIQITSAMPGEGKTTCARYLAQTLAAVQQGRYLLVDADLVNPTLHLRLHLPPVPGWTDYLVNGNTLDECIANTEIENLKVLAAGSLPPNPAAIFASKKMKHFVEELKERFDLIVFDSSPVLTMSSGAALGAGLDAAIMVVQAGRTKRQMVKKALALLSESRTNVIGVVLNQAVDNQLSYYGYERSQYARRNGSTKHYTEKV